MAKLRVLPNGKLYIHNGRLSMVNCCCGGGGETITCDYSEFNPEIAPEFPSFGLGFSGISYTITDDWNGQTYVGAPGVVHLSPRTSHSNGDPAIVNSSTGGVHIEYIHLECIEDSFDPSTFTFPGPPGTQMYLSHTWNTGDGGTGSGCVQTVWVNESGQAWQFDSGSGWHTITGSLTVLSKNPLHVIATFEPLSGSYPPDPGSLPCLGSEVSPGVVTIEGTE